MKEIIKAASTGSQYIYAISIFLSVLLIIGYLAWSQSKGMGDKRKNEIAQCMSAAEQKYNNSIHGLCNKNATIDCRIVIASLAPKLLDAINNTLNKDQEICIKIASS